MSAIQACGNSWTARFVPNAPDSGSLWPGGRRMRVRWSEARGCRLPKIARLIGYSRFRARSPSNRWRRRAAPRNRNPAGRRAEEDCPPSPGSGSELRRKRRRRPLRAADPRWRRWCGRRSPAKGVVVARRRRGVRCEARSNRGDSPFLRSSAFRNTSEVPSFEPPSTLTMTTRSPRKCALKAFFDGFDRAARSSPHCCARECRRAGPLRQR